jgi:predicted DCC family thiol-disulfide oxidoreductase YuxK
MTIVLFDGICNLCNSTVLFLIKHDSNCHLHFAAQQTEAGKNTMQQYGIAEENKSVILIKDNLVFYKSDAVIEIVKLLCGWPQILSYSKHIPKFVRDAIYDLVAKHRYVLFGKRTTCMTPSHGHKERFIL